MALAVFAKKEVGMKWSGIAHFLISTLAHQVGRKYFPYPVMDPIFVCWEEGDICEHMYYTYRALDFLSNVSSRGPNIGY